MHKYTHGIFILIVFACTLDKGESERTKRAARDCKDKFKVIDNHSACQWRSPDVQSAGVSDADIQEILDEHNNYRKSVTPAASNMLKMTWDTEVALVAQAWAETCSFSHDESKNRNIPGRLSAGQNIGTGYLSWKAAIKAWHDEVKDFTYNANNKFEKVGHYTQLVWATSNKIGCGMANCRSANFHVCNYSPAGNVDPINRPYKSGTRCGDCKPGNDGLCDCGDMVCENGGTLDPGTCKCSCKRTFNVGDRCKLDCRNLTEPSECGSGSYDASGCVRYSSTVPFNCPNTCNVCPTGGFNYTEGSSPVGNNGGSGNYYGIKHQLAVHYFVWTLFSKIHSL
ncbi:cysteine-rich venom protein-like [Mercenaria mercenaria]|uniref:cysteine-rich venom protein-like n=1 Tax=Mercenaria mercenaria TaxID=6596 RepID=UPI00234E95CC|nr:cysteine-rich venom protein-like [Mercenaria mercenaria]